MKLATYKDGSRDGVLLVVSRDLTQAVYPSGIANTLQAALDDWNFISPQLQDVSVQLNQHKLKHAFPFEPSRCMAPLPRAFQWVNGSAFLNHADLLRLARHQAAPANFFNEPLLFQGASDDFLGPMDDLICVDTAHGLDFEAGLAVITGDVSMQTSPELALESIRMVMLANGPSLRLLQADEFEKSSCLLQGVLPAAFSPVAVTPDELASLGHASPWRTGRLHLTVTSTWNGQAVGRCDAGEEMTFHFGQLIAHLCKTRNIRAGSVVGSGTISNRAAVDAQGKKTWPLGYSCIAEQRAIETLLHGAPMTDYMQFNDTIQIEMLGSDGLSIFGAIDQVVKPLQYPYV